MSKIACNPFNERLIAQIIYQWDGYRALPQQLGEGAKNQVGRELVPCLSPKTGWRVSRFSNSVIVNLSRFFQTPKLVLSSHICIRDGESSHINRTGWESPPAFVLRFLAYPLRIDTHCPSFGKEYRSSSSGQRQYSNLDRVSGNFRCYPSFRCCLTMR